MLCGVCLGTSIMFSSLEKLQFLLVVHYSHWFNPWVVLEGKGRGLRELFEASHLSRGAASRELDLNSGRSQSFVPAPKASLSSRCALPATDGPHSHWMRVARQLFISRQKYFALSFLSSRYAPPWTDETCHALVSLDETSHPPSLFSAADKFFPSRLSVIEVCTSTHKWDSAMAYPHFQKSTSHWKWDTPEIPFIPPEVLVKHPYPVVRMNTSQYRHRTSTGRGPYKNVWPDLHALRLAGPCKQGPNAFLCRRAQSFSSALLVLLLGQWALLILWPDQHLVGFVGSLLC